MSRIKIQDYIKDVELNRQRLVNATNSDNNSSLSSVVTSAIDKIYQVDTVNTSSNLFQVRFFDIDGNIIKSQWVEKGTTVIPPEIPYADSRLEPAE